MSKRSLLLILAALCLAPLPARAATAERTPPPGQVRLTGGVTGFDIDPSTMRPGNHLDRIGEALTRARSVGGSGMIALHDIVRAHAAGESIDAFFGFPIPAGDIDGDGKTDLITYEASFPDDTLVGRRGATGEALWRVVLAAEIDAPLTSGGYAATWTTFDDTDGDGVIDMIVFQIVQSTTFPRSVDRLAQSIAVYDGKTGARRWRWELDGAATQIDTDGGSAQAFDDVVWNLGYVADVNGDGNIDPFVQTCSRARIETAAVVIMPSLVADCTATHLDARTGATVASFPLYPGNRPSPPIVSPIGDMNGDGDGDVIIETYFYDSWVDMEVATATGDDLWWTYAEAADYTVAFPVDLRAAPGSDLGIYSLNWDEQYRSEGFGLRAHNGSTGDTLWSRSFPLTDGVGFTDDVNGDGLTDLQYTTATSSTVVTAAYDGLRFRTPLWINTMPVAAPPGLEASAYGGWLGDLTGDGTTEVGVIPYAYSDGESWWAGMRAIDGRTGATLWEVPEGETSPYALGVDMDGDGGADVARALDTTGGAALEVIDGLSFAHIWQTAPQADAAGGWAQPADLTGDAELELLMETNMDRGNRVSGEAPGVQLWAVTYSYDSGPGPF